MIEIKKDCNKLKYILDNLERDIDEPNKDEIIEKIILTVNPTWYIYRLLEKKIIEEEENEVNIQNLYDRIFREKKLNRDQINDLWKEQINDKYARDQLKVILTCCLINRERFLKEKYPYLDAIDVLNTLAPYFKLTEYEDEIIRDKRLEELSENLKTFYTKLNSIQGRWLEKQKGLIYRLTHKRFPNLFSEYIISNSKVRETYLKSIECSEERLDCLEKRLKQKS